MNRRFADAVYYIALLNPSDEWHREVLEFHTHSTDPICTTDAVLIEAANSFAGSPLRAKAAELVRAVRHSHDMQVLTISPSLFDRGIELFRAGPTKRGA